MSKISPNRFGQFLSWTLSSPDQNESRIDIDSVENTLLSPDGKAESAEQRMGKKIILRNSLLEILLVLVAGANKGQVDERSDNVCNLYCCFCFQPNTV